MSTTRSLLQESFHFGHWSSIPGSGALQHVGAQLRVVELSLACIKYVCLRFDSPLPVSIRDTGFV
jgi:hypothetical protein